MPAAVAAWRDCEFPHDVIFPVLLEDLEVVRIEVVALERGPRRESGADSGWRGRQRGPRADYRTDDRETAKYRHDADASHDALLLGSSERSGPNGQVRTGRRSETGSDEVVHGPFGVALRLRQVSKTKLSG